MDYSKPMSTIVELPEFLRKTTKLLSAEEKHNLLSYLAAHPHAGVVIQGTGGIRKLRWASGNQGKSGSVRVIYYYHNTDIPLFLLTAFAKNERTDLSDAQRNELAKLTLLLRKNYGKYYV